jgi:hypothetical protein
MKTTIKDILSYIEGNTKYLLDMFDLFPKYKQEQVTWRLLICKEDCVKNGECEYCGCPPHRKAFVDESCNGGDRYPDMMNADDWEKFKNEKNIELDEEGI